jgi:hypothetical protein
MSLGVKKPKETLTERSQRCCSGHFPHFGMRLNYTSMLVTYCLETADGSKTKPQKYWTKLSNDLEKLHSFKNKLAHQPTAEDKVIDHDEGTVLIWAKEMIIPNKFDKKKSFKPIEQADLDAHLLSVSAICHKLKSTCVSFPSWEEIASETFLQDDADDQEEGENE